MTVSLDSLDDATFRAMNGVGFPVTRVLEGIAAASAAGLKVKVNAVVKRGVNDGQIIELARHFRGTGHILRFIEYMDVGATNGWRLDDVVPAAEIVALIDRELPLEPAEENYRGEVARRWRYRDGGGEIGVIASVTQPFCGDCSGRASPPRVGCTRASSRRPASIFAHSSAPARPSGARRGGRQGVAQAVGPLFGDALLTRPSLPRASRCRTSAARRRDDALRRDGRPSWSPTRGSKSGGKHSYAQPIGS